MIGWTLNFLRNLLRAALNAALFLIAGWLLRLAFAWTIVVILSQ